ncbi:hypothetical protein DBA29_19660 [Xenophilus aerolatus]|nr:hypothetical protein [Xenophilus aerolatus]
MSKTNIKSFGKPYTYLKDPELRTKETRDAQLVIKDALFSGVDFKYLTWKNIRFVNCDFAGGYEIKLTAMENCAFESCKILGIHDFGAMNKVRFYKCLSGGASNWGGNVGSKEVFFEECRFIGETSDRNQQGSVGAYGEAVFVNCKAKWFDIAAETRLEIRGCEFEDITCGPGLHSEDGAPVVIEGSKLLGEFRMHPARLASLTIRDTQLDLLDLTGATVKGDVVIERVKGGALKAGFASRNFTLKDSQIYGPAEQGKPVFDTAIAASETFLIDNVQFASGLQDLVGVGEGRALGANEWSATPRNKMAIIRNSRLPRIDASWLETQHLQLQGNEIGSLDVSNSRIGQLEISGNTINRGVDFSHTQAKQANVQRLRSDQAKLEGSNLKLPR